jgi:hypothetical protein
VEMLSGLEEVLDVLDRTDGVRKIEVVGHS